MSMYLQTSVDTPEGPKTYIVRESAGAFYNEGPITPIFAPEAGDEFAAEFWGEDGSSGPYFDVVLRRTSGGWIEIDRSAV